MGTNGRPVTMTRTAGGRGNSWPGTDLRKLGPPPSRKSPIPQASGRSGRVGDYTDKSDVRGVGPDPTRPGPGSSGHTQHPAPKRLNGYRDRVGAGCGGCDGREAARSGKDRAVGAGGEDVGKRGDSGGLSVRVSQVAARHSQFLDGPLEQEGGEKCNHRQHEERERQHEAAAHVRVPHEFRVRRPHDSAT